MGKRLYVGNLSYDTTEDSLRTAFEADGRSVTDILIMTDRETGRPRGFGFVEMSSDSEAQAAIEAMNGTNELRLHVFGNAEHGQAVGMGLLDNLGKGAAGQAVHNMNLMLGLDEAVGLV